MSATITLTNDELAAIVQRRHGKRIIAMTQFGPAITRCIRELFGDARIVFIPGKVIFKFYSEEEAVLYRLRSL